MESFLFSANAVIPMFLLMGFGYLLTLVKIWDKNFLKTANRLCFRGLFPIMVFYTIFHANISDMFAPSFALYASCAALVVFALAMIFVPLAVKSNYRRGVIIQSMFRGNYLLLGVPLCTSMFGQAGAAAAAFLAVIFIPIFNVLATVALCTFNGGNVKRDSIPVIILKILRNPLVIGCLAGGAALALRMKFGFTFPPLIDGLLEKIKLIATPFALIVLGGDFEFRGFLQNIKTVSLIAVFRLILIPAVAITVSALLGYHGLELGLLICVFATPVAVSSCAMSLEMNCDYDLSAHIVVFTSVASAATMFLAIFICHSLGIL